METGQKGGFGLPCVLIFLKFFYFFHEIFSIPIRPNHLSPRRHCLLRHGHTYRCQEMRFPNTRHGHTYRPNQSRFIDTRHGHAYRYKGIRFVSIDC